MPASRRRGTDREPTRVEVAGASGQRYTFNRLELDQPLRQVGVTYVIAARQKAGWRVLHAGETNDLAAGAWRAYLDEARREAPKAQCLIRLNVSRAIRAAEVEDILQAQAPPDETA